MDTVKPATETVSAKSSKSPKDSAVGRRALLVVTATAGVVGVCGVTTLAAPQLRNTLEQDVTALGRQALAHELTSLEGVTLDDAIKAAEITQAAVRLLVLPLAQLVATIGGMGWQCC